MRLLARRPDGIFVAPTEQGVRGPDLFRAACNMGLEGLVSKCRDPPIDSSPGELPVSLARNIETEASVQAARTQPFRGLRTWRGIRSPLVETEGFGTNPGDLRMFSFVPDSLQPAPALVVVLHGCGQTAAGYDLGAGWSTLAKHYGFVLLMPEQQTVKQRQRVLQLVQSGRHRARARRQPYPTTSSRKHRTSIQRS